MNAVALEFTMVCSVWLLGALVVEGVVGLWRRWQSRRAIKRRIAASHPTSTASMSTKVPAKAPLNSRTLNIIQPSRV